MSTLKVDSLVEKTSGNGVHIAGHSVNSEQHQWSSQTIVNSGSNPQGFVDCFGSDYTYVTKTSNSKIMITGIGMAYMSSGGANGYGIGIFRGSTNIISPFANWGLGPHSAGVTYGAVPWQIQVLDSPNVPAGTSLVYKLMVQLHTTGNSLYMNYGGTWNGLSNSSNFIFTEIAQ